MATFQGVWNSIRGLQTTAGTFVSFYHPGEPDEWVTIVKPDGGTQDVRTPALVDWFLAAEDGVVVIHYARNDGGGKTPVRVPTAIACGQPTAWLVTGGTGPAGPAGTQGPQGPPGATGAAGSDGKDAEVDEATMQRIAALTAEQVLLGGPAGDHYGLAPNAQFGTRHQENIAVMFTNQAFWQEVIKAIDTAALGLQSGGYTPKVQGG
jgi:hypothetical protein